MNIQLNFAVHSESANALFVKGVFRMSVTKVGNSIDWVYGFC